jgi:hypothetical protein
MWHELAHHLLRQLGEVERLAGERVGVAARELEQGVDERPHLVAGARDALQHFALMRTAAARIALRQQVGKPLDGEQRGAQFVRYGG